jgi:hypothetical protein
MALITNYKYISPNGLTKEIISYSLVVLADWEAIAERWTAAQAVSSTFQQFSIERISGVLYANLILEYNG